VLLGARGMMENERSAPRAAIEGRVVSPLQPSLEMEVGDRDRAVTPTRTPSDDTVEARVKVQVVPTLGICPSPRESASICWTPTGALLFGGYSGKMQASLSELWLLQFNTTEWEMLEAEGASPEARAGHVAAIIADGRMAVFGGINKSRFLADTWVYDMMRRRWTAVETEKHPAARQGAGARAVHGALYLFGGSGREGVLGDMWVLERGGWTEIELGGGVPRPLSCSDPVLTRWSADLLLVGGRVAGDDGAQPIWRFDTELRGWSVLHPKPIRRARHSAVVLNDAALLIAGGCADSPMDFAEPPIAVLDLRESKWVDLDVDELDIHDSPSKRASASDAFYDFSGGTWVSPGSTAQRNDFNLVAVGPASAWIWGGRDGSGYCEPATWLIELAQRPCTEIVDTPRGSPLPGSRSEYRYRPLPSDDNSDDSRDTLVDDDEGTCVGADTELNDEGAVGASSVFQSISFDGAELAAAVGHGHGHGHGHAAEDTIDSPASRNYLTLDDLPRDDAETPPAASDKDGSTVTSGTSSLETLPEIAPPLAGCASPAPPSPSDGSISDGRGGASLDGDNFTLRAPQGSRSGSGGSGPFRSMTGRNASMWRRMSSNIEREGGVIGEGDAVVDVQLGEWASGELLGRGAFGSVFKCMDRGTGEIFAGKRLNFALLKEDDMQKLAKELKTLRRLSHRHIVSYRGYDASNTELWIFMDYCAGGDLHQSFKQFGGLTAKLAARYTHQILLGLQYLHENNVLHRDIKGANILLTVSGQAKLSDFGLATMLASESGKSSMYAGSEVVGSPYWMSPEVITGKGSKRASDIWSLGCTVFEMAATAPPNAEMEPMAALFHVGSSREMPPPPRQLGEAGCDFVRACLQHKTVDRPNCAALLAHPFVAAEHKAMLDGGGQ